MSDALPGSPVPIGGATAQYLAHLAALNGRRLIKVTAGGKSQFLTLPDLPITVEWVDTGEQQTLEPQLPAAESEATQ